MAIELHIGLAPGVNGFYDEKTRVYLSGEKRHEALVLADGTDLQGLARGLFTMYPAIILYKGEFPADERDKFLARYENKFAIVDRATRIAKSLSPEAPLEGQNVGTAQVIAPEGVEAQSTQGAELIDITEEKPTAKGAKPRKPASK